MDEEVINYLIEIDDYYDSWQVAVKQEVVDHVGAHVGWIATDAVFYARTELGASLKAYLVKRAVESGKIDPVPLTRSWRA